MRDFAKVSPQFWSGKTGKALKARGTEAMLVGMYLMTCQHSNMLGLYYLSKYYIAADTGLGFEGASKGLRLACEAGFCSYDEESEVVWVHEMAATQIADHLSPKDNRCVGIQKEYESLPENPFLPMFYDRYAEAFHLTRKIGGSEPAPNPLASPSEAPPKQGEGEGEGEQKPVTVVTDAAAAPSAEKPVLPIPGEFTSSDREILWTVGVPLLVDAGGEDNASRKVLGALVKKHGERRVAEAVLKARMEKPIDPVAYIGGLLKPEGGRRRSDEPETGPGSRLPATGLNDKFPIRESRMLTDEERRQFQAEIEAEVPV